MDVIGPIRETPVEEIGYMLPRLLLPLWDSEVGKGFIATLRSLLAGSEVGLIRSFLQEVIAAEVGPRVDNPPGSGRIRVQFVASQLVGVVMARYILELDPFKSLPVEQIAETIGPNSAALSHRRSSGLASDMRRSVLVVGHVDGLVDQQNGDAVVDSVGPAQPGVVQYVVHVQQRPTVCRTDQNAQQLLVELRHDQRGGPTA